MLSWRTPSFQITDCICRQGGQSKQPWRDRMPSFTHRRRWRRPAWGCLWSCCTSQTSTFCSAGSELWTSPSWGYFQRSHSCSPDGHKEKKKMFFIFTHKTKRICRELEWKKCPYGPDELLWKRTLGPEAFGLERHVLLRLGVEGRVLDQRVYKHPDVVLHLDSERPEF